MQRKGTLPTCWWECKLVQPLRTTVGTLWGVRGTKEQQKALHLGNGAQGKSEVNRTLVLSCLRDGA